MKRLLCLILVLLLVPSAQAEEYVYPVYEVIGGQGWLFSTPDGSGMENVLLVLPEGTRVIAGESRGMVLVSTQEGYCGYMRGDFLQDTGETVTWNYPLEESKVNAKEDIDICYITIAENAVLREEIGEYPAAVFRGEATHDTDALLTLLLGEGYREEKSEWSGDIKYTETGALEPWESKSVYIYEDGSLHFYDPSVSGERGGEYEPPCLNMLPDESVLILKGLLQAYFTGGETDYVGNARRITERWSYADRWMTDAEYRDFMYGHDLHYFEFEHRSNSGLSILGDSLFAGVGVNGLNGFTLNWHDFSESSQTMTPMPLTDAVKLANSTRLAPATLLYADLVYSNRVTENGEYNLCWYLATDAGNYVVDCVLQKHVCDSYEY